jgi:hypothetical protein
MPTVQAGGGAITFGFPLAPAGATAWRVSVGAKVYPDLPIASTSFAVSGLYPGYPASWTVRVVNAGARSLPVSGQAVP